jgi:Tfp pilus assembly protein PilV
MIAVLILMAVMVPLMESYTQSSRAADSSRKQLAAAFLAVQYLEELRGLGYDELASRPEAEAEGFAGFSWWAEVAPGPAPGVKTMAVTVEYAGADGPARVTLTTAKSRR